MVGRGRVDEEGLWGPWMEWADAVGQAGRSLVEYPGLSLVLTAFVPELQCSTAHLLLAVPLAC